ncbi:MAG: galactose-1-phosphate uridylyltransferase [Planctomycetota bacterium]
MPEIRYNVITGDWVILATDRAKRPEDFSRAPEKQKVPTWNAMCPFCPGNEIHTPIEHLRLTEGTAPWLLRSVPNKFSVLTSEGEISHGCEGLKRHMSGVGLHEVLIETPEHHLTTALLPLKQVERILLAYKLRFLAFYEDPRIEHVILFKNHGFDAGTSLEHPHSQIVGTPVIPGQVRTRIDEAKRFYETHGECLYCQTLHEEQQEGARLVAENYSFVAFIPYAALSPFHLWIFPRQHQSCFGSLTEDALVDLAQILKEILLKLYISLENPSFNYVIRSLPPKEGAVRHFHWYLAIVPRLSKAAGFEMGTGMYINTALPEKNAKFLKDFQIP